MGAAIGIAFTVLTVVVYGLDTRIAGYVVGVLVLMCLAVCEAAFWLDTRTARTTDRLRHRSH